MAAFPPGKGGGEGVAHGYKGKGVLIHSIVDANGMPLCVSVTPANGNERAQVCPMLDGLCVHTGRPGRPRSRPAQIAADKGYDSQPLREDLRARNIRPELPRRVFKNRRQPPGRKLTQRIARFVVERTFSWYQRKFRRLAVRWERRERYFNGFLDFGFLLIWVDRILLG